MLLIQSREVLSHRHQSQLQLEMRVLIVKSRLARINRLLYPLTTELCIGLDHIIHISGIGDIIIHLPVVRVSSKMMRLDVFPPRD